MSDQSQIDRMSGGTAMSRLSSQREQQHSYETSVHTLGNPPVMTSHTPHLSMAPHPSAHAQHQRSNQSPHAFKPAAPGFQPLNSTNIYLQDSSTLRQDASRRAVSDNYRTPRPRPPPAGLYDSSAMVIRQDGSWARPNTAGTGTTASPVMHFQPPPPPPGPPGSAPRAPLTLENNQGQAHAQAQAQSQAQAQAQAQSQAPAQLWRPLPQNAYATQARPNEADSRMRNEAQMRVLRRNMGNAGVLRVLDVIDFVTQGSPDQLCNLVFWQRLIAGNFLPSSVVTIHLGPSGKHSPDPRNNEGNLARPKQQTPSAAKVGLSELVLPQTHSAFSKLYKLQMATFPRFLLAAALDLQVAKLDMNLGCVECQVLSNAYINMSGKVVLHYVYVDGSRATVNGRFNLQLNRELRILLIDYWFMEHVPSITLDRLTQELELAHGHHRNTLKSFAASLAETCVAKLRAASFGFGNAVIRTMKLSDAMAYLKPIINFGATRKINSPHHTMEMYVAMSKASGSTTPAQTEFNPIKEVDANAISADSESSVKRPAGPAFEFDTHHANGSAAKMTRR